MIGIDLRTSGLMLSPLQIGPVEVEEAPAWLIDAFIGVGAKVIALGLQ